ncbi:hypothetical protein BC629DRAFT_999454 [Irpex lacteus]|nr:hypothetical protein BC629DRAFT_999454 [Irpex lacteus]
MYKGLRGCRKIASASALSLSLLPPVSFDMGDQPTPPHPNDGSGDPEQNPAHPPGAADPSPPVSISSTFHPAANLDHTPPNTLILSSDRILFVVHYRWLYAQSVNLFNGLLLNTVEPPPENPLARSVSERAQVIEILFHAAYNLPFPPHTPTPSLECLEEVIVALHTYGFLPIQRFIATGSPLHTAFVNHAQSKPMEIYALAASREFEDLAVAASPYTLRMSVNRIPAPLVDRWACSTCFGCTSCMGTGRRG